MLLAHVLQHISPCAKPLQYKSIRTTCRDMPWHVRQSGVTSPLKASILFNAVHLTLAVLTARGVVATCKQAVSLRSLWKTDVMEIRRCNCRGNRMHQPRQLTPPAYYGAFWTPSFTSLTTCLHVATTPAAAMPRLTSEIITACPYTI